MLLDLIAHRYPGTKPSDIYGLKSEDNPNGLDEYQAFQLDAGLAYRYSALEEETFARHMHDIRESIKLTGRFHGKKNLRYNKFTSDIGDTHDDDDENEDGSDGLLRLGNGSVIE